MSIKKVMNKQKDEIKKLTRGNDTLRREISRHTGIRKFTCDTNGNLSEVYNEHIKFRKKITNIATSLIDALDIHPELDDSVTATSGKLKSQSNDIASDRRVSDIAFTPVSYSRTVSGLHAHSIRHRAPRPTVTYRPTRTDRAPSSPPTETTGHLIPVHLGIGSNQAKCPPSDGGEATRHQRRSGGHRSMSVPGSAVTDETVIIGTSLINGLSVKVNSLGVPATSYMHRGTHVPHIQSQIRQILNSAKQP